MKNFLTVLAVTAFCISCSKKQSTPDSAQTDSTKIIDSINAVRTKINNDIRSKNRFRDFSGTHKFTHNLIKKTGSVNFTKIEDERDHYKVAGDAKSGKDYMHIQGDIKIVSDKHMNFTGNISESISENDNGKPYVRKGTKTFMSKDGGKTYRLQDMVNGSGFVDYIDIHF
ncbi:hypothetical protein MKJ01_07425 [Chryseobacterium sp. SSA4.19]|uniref:hypothetical protein n=1 Tax=Chryseobacterium sp. SSA4.19 TaxID=2919915 RepID=UPI001F4DDE00|nr:hypothetical protein [Chryseobacterium sp. SSA4.19]MCJ8153593.1 hypothetical protein [Chryseobacterium sp. SSA4.19]